MNYKETIFFIGKCLTINHENHNKILVEQQLKTNAVDWDNVVRVSTGHFVFPALYCNLKYAGFLHYLPNDLVEYMEHITQLNRERNEEIIRQARELNELLLANNITPIFLKGTAFLLYGLYNDIGERMVGDIDFLVSNEEFLKVIDICKKHGYSNVDKEKVENTSLTRHYPKMIKDDRIASVEVHYRMVSDEKMSFFNYDLISSEVQTKNNVHFLSDKHNAVLTILNSFINEFNHILKGLTFRGYYDLLLLSKKVDTKEIVRTDVRYHSLNDFLYSTYKILGEPKSIRFIKNNKVEKYFKKQLWFIERPDSHNKYFNVMTFFIDLGVKLKFIFNAPFKNENRIFLIKKLKSYF